MRILTPTDFSSCSKSAIKAAADLALLYDAELDLFHSIDDFFPWSDISFDDKQINLKEISKKRLDAIKKDLDEKGIATRVFVKEGSFLSEIEKQSEDNNYDLIVMGSHGISGKSEWFIGSKTQKVIRRVRNRVLVIKEELANINFTKSLFVTGFDEDDLVAFENFIQFIEPFKVSEIHLLTVNTLGYFSEPSKEQMEVVEAFQNMAKDYEVFTHFYEDYSVDSGVRHFCNEKEIDLIAISNHSRHPVKRLFQGSNVEIIINHSRLPVLTIDFDSKSK